MAFSLEAVFHLIVASCQARWSREGIFGLGTYAITMTAIRVVHDTSSFSLDFWNISNRIYYVLKNGQSQVENNFYSITF
ncbi:MAG: hypothetical protein SAMD01599839_17860 [Rectinema sp.]